MWWHSWLRHCATSQTVTGLIPNGVSAIFHWHNPSSHTTGPGVDSASNKQEYQEYFLGGKGSWCVGLTTLPTSCAYCHESWEPQPPGTLMACSDLYRDYAAFTLLTIQLQCSIISIKILYFSFLTCCHVLFVFIIAKYILFQNSHHYTYSHSVKKWNPYLELLP
jgi:hypothetical protein